MWTHKQKDYATALFQFFLGNPEPWAPEPGPRNPEILERASNPNFASKILRFRVPSPGFRGPVFPPKKRSGYQLGFRVPTWVPGEFINLIVNMRETHKIC